MRDVREVLRLKHAVGRSLREIARVVGVSPATALEYVRRAEVVGVTWPVPDAIDDAALEALLFPAPAAPSVTRPEPDWAEIHAEMKRKGVTLALLWEEYRAGRPDGYGYSRFCDLYRNWRGRTSPVMRQTHQAGDKLFVDYAGMTLDIYLPDGEVRAAHLFVAVMGASSYTFATLRWSEGLEDWIDAHASALDFFGGAPAAIVPDNLKSGVTKPSRYEPGINRTYAEFAGHYETAILPARIHRPRDKAKVEAGVLVAERWILACLRHQRFFSLEHANAAVRLLQDRINAKIMRIFKRSRLDLFGEVDAPELKPLPREPYVYAEWRKTGPRLSCRDRRALVLGAVSADQRAGRGARHGPHCRDLSQGIACGGPSALADETSPHDDARTHALEPSPSWRVDAEAAESGSGRYRRRHQRACRTHSRRSSPSRAGLSRLHGDLVAEEARRR